MIYLKLFWSFFQIGAFSFGGSMAAMPLIQNQVVDTYGWLTLAEFTDLITISQMTPGPIAINSATFVGTQIAGLTGALVSTLGCVLPSCTIVMLLAWMYGRFQGMTVITGILAGLRPTVVALILAAGLSILRLSFCGNDGFTWDISAVDLVAVILFLTGVCLLRKFKLNPVFVMLVSGVLGGACYLITGGI